MDQATHNKIVSFIWGIADESSATSSSAASIPT